MTAPPPLPDGRRKRPSTGSEVVRKHGKWVALASALITAATPGAYAAWQAAKTAFRQRVEASKADEQETTIAKNLEALRAQVAALEKTFVTHRELVDLVVKLRASAAAPTPRRVDRPAVDRAREDLGDKLDALRRRVETAETAREAARRTARAAPPIRPPDVVRRMVQRKAEAAE